MNILIDADKLPFIIVSANAVSHHALTTMSLLCSILYDRCEFSVQVSLLKSVNRIIKHFVKKHFCMNPWLTFTIILN